MPRDAARRTGATGGGAAAVAEPRAGRERASEQPAHTAPASAAPHSEQKRPVAGARARSGRLSAVLVRVEDMRPKRNEHERALRSRRRASLRSRRWRSDDAALATRAAPLLVRCLPPGCEICSTVFSALRLSRGHASTMSACATMPTSSPRSSTIGMRRTCSRPMSSMTSSTESSGALVRTPHDITSPTERRGAVAAFGDGADGDVAIGETPTRRLRVSAPHVDDGHDADVLLLHEPRGLDERRVRRSRTSDSST